MSGAGVKYEPYRAAYLAALRVGDEHEAREVVERAQQDGLSPAQVYFEVFAPSMVMIGTLWEQNDISVAEEHVATAITERLIAALSPSFSPPQREHTRHRGTVILGCVAGERHVLGLRMLADLFREQDWRVLDLGADVPIGDWVELARRYGVDVVAIATTTSRHLPAVKSLVDKLRTELPHIRILVGGAVFDQNPDLWQEIGADAYDPAPARAVAMVDTLADSKPSTYTDPGDDGSTN